MNAFGFLYPCMNNVVTINDVWEATLPKYLISTLRDGIVHYIKEVGVDVI